MICRDKHIRDVVKLLIKGDILCKEQIEYIWKFLVKSCSNIANVIHNLAQIDKGRVVQSWVNKTQNTLKGIGLVNVWLQKTEW